MTDKDDDLKLLRHRIHRAERSMAATNRRLDKALHIEEERQNRLTRLHNAGTGGRERTLRPDDRDFIRNIVRGQRYAIADSVVANLPTRFYWLLVLINLATLTLAAGLYFGWMYGK